MGDTGENITSATDLALARLQPALRNFAQTSGNQEVPVAVEAAPGADPGRLMLRSFTRPPIDGEPVITFGYVKAGTLLKLASLPDVSTIRLQVFGQDYFPPPPDPDTHEFQVSGSKFQVPKPETRNSKLETLDWFDVGPGHHSAAAWAKGFRGQGVRVSVQDDGIDFAHPDLLGTYATVPPTITLPTGVYTSPYSGWPMVFDPYSMLLYAEDVYFGKNHVASGRTHYVDIRATPPITRTADDLRRGLARFTYAPLRGPSRNSQYQSMSRSEPHEYVFRDTSRSGVYHIGSHPDDNLLDRFGERVAVLVVDEHVPGVYDTVYVDLNNDLDFTDERPATRDEPVFWRDLDGDGNADLSGGILYFIADGVHPIPASNWLYGIGQPGRPPVPGNASLLAFAGALEYGYSHGTQVASNVVGQGKLATYAPFFRDLPGGQPAGMVWGAAPGARLVDTSDIYFNYLQSRKDAILFAALGYDGERNSGDEIQIASESHGRSEADNDGWTDYSRYIDHQVRRSPNLSVVLAVGNGGPGYGTQPDHDPETAINVGASTEFGSTGWDSITSTSQILFGDAAWFSNRGPGARGTAGPHILANGDRGPGAEAINYSTNNRQSAWDTWGGTSRSAPVAAGNLALVYQAFRQRTGHWPTWQEARSILTSGARDALHDVFTQGAGVIDADRATDIAAGRAGVYVTPDTWRPGDYRGQVYPAFANLLSPGATATQAFTLTNPSSRPVTVTLAAQNLRRIGSRTLSLKTAPVSQESPWNFFAPDYLIPLDPATIPAATQLMVVRMHFPYNEFDPNGDYYADSRWYLYVYDWTDINQNGRLWTDQDSNGVVNHLNSSNLILPDEVPALDWSHSEIERWEYARFAYARSTANSATLTIRDPVHRMHTGLFLGLQHRDRSANVPITHFTFQLDFYAQAAWPLLEVPATPIQVPAGSTATFQASARVPPTQPPGFYEGAIYIQQAPDPARFSKVYLPLVASALSPGPSPRQGVERTAPAAPRTPKGEGGPVVYSPLPPRERGTGGEDRPRSALPVILNVASQFNGRLEFGGVATLDPDSLYDNGSVRGTFDWSWRSDAGDWRQFFFDVPNVPLNHRQRLVTRTLWSDPPPTDLDTIILGPVSDPYSNPTDPANQEGSLADPGFYGPYTLDVVGRSNQTNFPCSNDQGGCWRFDTVTGGSEEWVTSPITTGLHSLLLHAVNFRADQFQVPFTTTVATFDVTPATVDMVATAPLTRTQPVSGTVFITFTSGITLSNLAGTAYGLSRPEFLPAQPIAQNIANDPTTASYTRDFTLTHASRLFVQIDGFGQNDVDLYLLRDVNGDGQFNFYQEYIASSTAAAGQPDSITLRRPPDGRYRLLAHGYAVAPSPSTFDLTIDVIQGFDLRVTGLPAGPVPAEKPLRLAITYEKLMQPGEEWHGEIIFGPGVVPDALSVPVILR